MNERNTQLARKISIFAWFAGTVTCILFPAVGLPIAVMAALPWTVKQFRKARAQRRLDRHFEDIIAMSKTEQQDRLVRKGAGYHSRIIHRDRPQDSA